MKRLLLWGLGNEYEGLLNSIKFEIYKKNIDVLAVVVRKEDKYCSKKDGFQIITKEAIGSFDFDYLVVTSSAYYNEIKSEAIKIGVEENRIISASVFYVQCFDFEKYIQLIENPVTILSDDCWGGLIYNRLGLRFSSPLVNTRLQKEDYIRLVQDPFYYFEKNLEMDAEGDIRTGIWPIGKIGDGEKKIKIMFPHSLTFDGAKENWDRRRNRINKNNLFLKMNLFDNSLINGKVSYSADQLRTWANTFSSLPYKKILFYAGEEISQGFVSPRFLWNRGFLEYDYQKYCREQYLYDVDILSLLTEGKDFSRYE